MPATAKEYQECSTQCLRWATEVKTKVRGANVPRHGPQLDDGGYRFHLTQRSICPSQKPWLMRMISGFGLEGSLFPPTESALTEQRFASCTVPHFFVSKREQRAGFVSSEKNIWPISYSVICRGVSSAACSAMERAILQTGAIGRMQRRLPAIEPP